MRIFHIITHFDVGGAERVAVNIAKSKTAGIEYHVVEVVRVEGVFCETFLRELEGAHVHYHRSYIKSSKFAILCFPFLFVFLFLKWKPKVIHTHTEIPDLSIYLWSRMFGWLFPHIKYVRTIHNTKLWNQWHGVGDKVEAFFKQKQANIAISSSTQKCYKNNYGESPRIVFNGLQIVRQKTFDGIVKKKINILFAGRFEYQKGIDQLIAVVTALGNNKEFHFHIVGNGSMKEKVCLSLSVFDNVSLYDKIYGLNQYIGSFDYLFMPSNHEGLALMPIEASFAHTPSIINNCPGLRDTLPADWPLKVDDNNVDDFVKLIESLDNSDNYNIKYKKYADMAYNFAKENFSIEKMQHEYESIYCG